MQHFPLLGMWEVEVKKWGKKATVKYRNASSCCKAQTSLHNKFFRPAGGFKDLTPE